MLEAHAQTVSGKLVSFLLSKTARRTTEERKMQPDGIYIAEYRDRWTCFRRAGEKLRDMSFHTTEQAAEAEARRRIGGEG